MYAFLIFGLLTIFLLRIINKKSPPPVFGIYQKPRGWYWLKVAFIYFVLQIRRLQNAIFTSKNDDKTTAGYGIKSRYDPESMDCRQTLSDHSKAIDAVYFNLANKSDWNLVVGLAIRPANVVDGFMYLQIPGIGLLLTPKLPSTLLHHESTDESFYYAEGIKLTPFMAMRTWRIQYNGPMRLENEDGTTESKEIELDAVWSSNLPMFDFDTDMDPLAVAKAMAREPWSREYFETVKDFHQTHYEQHGDFNGFVKVDGVHHRMVMQGVRDHSYGRRREWKNFHRYALHFITLETGERMSIGIICAPLAFSRIEIGYYYTIEGEVLPIQSCDLQIEQHGENGVPPLDYAFTFQAGGKSYTVQVLVQASPEFYVGHEWEARVVERLAHFKVNGVIGWGASEWEYRHMDQPVK